MKLKSTLWKNLVTGFKLFYLVIIVSMLALIGFLAYIGLATEAVTNQKLVNTVTFSMALASLPGSLVILLDLFGELSNKKRNLALQGQCPHCFQQTTFYIKPESRDRT